MAELSLGGQRLPRLVAAPVSARPVGTISDAQLESLVVATREGRLAVLLAGAAGQSRAGAGGASALIYAVARSQFVTPTARLLPGSDLTSWARLNHLGACAAVCEPLASEKEFDPSSLRHLGAHVVNTDAELQDLISSPSTVILWGNLASATGRTLAPLSPGRPRRPVSVVRAKPHPRSEVPIIAGIAAIALLALLALGRVIRRHSHRQPHPPDRSQDPASSPRPQPTPSTDPASPEREPPGDPIARRTTARIRTELIPEGYVELDACLRRAAWTGEGDDPPVAGEWVVVEDDGCGLHAVARATQLETRPSTT